MSDVVPEPPDHVEPRTTRWRAGRRLYRVHSDRYRPAQFNPGNRGRPGRFHPIREAGRLIPTLYAADRIEGVLSETLFHNVLAGGLVLRAELIGRCITSIRLSRDILAADLTGHGLRKLKLNRTQLLECEAPHSADTARWAEAIHGCDRSIEAMIWVSRQFDTAKAILVFGDRFREDDFTIEREPERLDRGAGYRRVQQAAAAAGITIVEG